VTIDLSVFGPLEVADRDGSFGITGPKERVALAVLVAWAGEMVSTDRLTDAVWRDQPPRSSDKAIQNLLFGRVAMSCEHTPPKRSTCGASSKQSAITYFGMGSHTREEPGHASRPCVSPAPMRRTPNALRSRVRRSEACRGRR